MTRFLSVFILAAAIGCSSGFTSPGAFPQHRLASLHSSALDEEGPMNVVVEGSESQANPASPKPVKKNSNGGHGQDGILAPFVILMKEVLGEKELIKLRAQVIGKHSKIIGNFVETADSKFGEIALKALFELADEDNNGTIEEEELGNALRSLGFRHLNDKQISGIFARADSNASGSIDYEEWKKTAPKTLRTNLVKLAKTNGGELGFLA